MAPLHAEGLAAHHSRTVEVVDPLKQIPQSEGLRYFRLHGVTGYRYLHTEQDLQTVVERCAMDAPTYVLFNNLFMGGDALRLVA
jgi:uncharacterized protein YecE (DUF72 family)